MKEKIWRHPFDWEKESLKKEAQDHLKKQNKKKTWKNRKNKPRFKNKTKKRYYIILLYTTVAFIDLAESFYISL